MRTIAVDCGASFLKAALFDERGKIIRKTKRPAPKPQVWDQFLRPVQIKALASETAAMILELAKEGDSFLLCISNEMHGFLLTDAQGEPYTDYISWQKELGAISINGRSGMDFLKRETLRREVEATGMPVRAGLPSCNLWYLSRSGYLEKASGKLFFYTLGDYLIRMLAGCEPYCHVTNAAATGLFDLRTKEWNGELIRQIAKDSVVFPAIGEEKTQFEMEGKRFCALPAIGDQQAALLGAGLKDSVSLSFNIGTGGQVSVLAREAECSDRYQIRPYFDGYYLKTLPHIPSGRALNVYVRFVESVLEAFGKGAEDAEVWDVLQEKAENAGGSDLDCDLSFFENAVTGHRRGGIMNIGEHDLTLGNLMGCAFEKLADNFIWAAGAVCPDVSRIERIIFSGGVAARIPKVKERILSSFGKEVEVVNASDETLFGLWRYGH